MVSPPDKNDGDVGAGAFGGQWYAGVNGDRFVYMALGGWNAPTNSVTGVYLAKREDDFWVSRSGLLPVLPYSELGGAVVNSVSPDGSRVITVVNRNVETGEPFANGEWGVPYLVDGDTGAAEMVVPDLDIQGNPTSNNFNTYAGSDDYSTLFLEAAAPLVPEAVGLPGSGDIVYLYDDGEHEIASRLPDETPIRGTIPTASTNALAPYPVSADGTVLYFGPGFGAGDTAGLYRRDFSGATPETVRVNDPETEQEPGGSLAATFVGASADGNIAYFTSNQKLVDEDTDNVTDLYRYDHSEDEGSRLTLISVDGEPGDDHTGVERVHSVSADGSTVVFSSRGQLVPGETTDPGAKLYVARNGQVEFVGITGPAGFAGEINAHNVALTADGSRVGLLTAAPLTADDNGGFEQVYVRDNITGDIECASCLDGAANTAAAAFSEPAALTWFGDTADRAVRNVSTQGHVFFQTPEALLPRDTNGKMDVYVWQDGELDLISSGRSSDNSWYADSTPDGKDVFFVTRERLSGWDFDDHLDIYTARVGGGLPEPPEPVAPCTGSDCQGPPPLPPAFPEPGTSDADGPGNADPGTVDCTPAERKASRLANKAQQAGKKAKRLKKQARKASGKKAKRLGKRAKKAQRQAKAKRKQARQARNQLALCREEAEL